MRKGINIDGLGVTLKDIADAIKNPELFSYDAASKTAICHTDLNIKGGAELIIDGQTLKMDSASDGQRVIRMNNGAALKMDNATITSTNDHYFQWAFTDDFHPDYTWNPVSFTGGAADFNFKGIFVARDSTIDNCGFMYMVGPNTVILENTKFTNMVQIKGRRSDSQCWGQLRKIQRACPRRHVLPQDGHAPIRHKELPVQRQG